jgi:hypothetical protein
MQNDEHFLEMIHTAKQSDNTFKALDAWYDKHYGPDAHKHVYAVLSIWTHYMERNGFISISEMIDGLAPNKWYYAGFSDLSDEQNALLPYRVLAMYLSKVRLTEVNKIPGYRQYVDTLQS